MSKVLQSVPAREEPFRYVKTGDTLALSDWLHFQLDEVIAQNSRKNTNQGGGGEGAGDHQQPLLTNLLDELRDVSHKRSTLLHWAAYLGSSDMVEMLLHYGASTIVTEEDGKTPLHWAAFEGHLAVVDQLLNPPPQVIGVTPAGVQPYLMRDTLGHTPCHLAVMNEHKAVAMKFKNYNEVQRNGSVSPLRTSTPREQPQAQVPVPRAGASQQTSTSRSSDGKSTSTAASTAQTDAESSSTSGTGTGTGSSGAGRENEEVRETKGIVVSGAQPHGRNSTASTASQGEATQSAGETKQNQPAPSSASSTQPHPVNHSQSSQELHSSKVTTPTRNSRWEAARSNNPNSKPYILSTRTAAPPSLAGLKKLAEEEAASERREISRGMGPGGSSAERWDDSRDSVDPLPMRFSKTQHSPGGIQTSAPYEAAASYDSVAAQEEDPYADTAELEEEDGPREGLGAETDEEEARLRAEEEETEKRLALLQRRMRRQERADRLEQLRKEIGRTVTELVSEGQPLPTDLRQLLEDSRCLDKIQIQWVPRQESASSSRRGGGGKRREAGPTPQRSEEGSRSRNRRNNMNASNDSVGRSSRSVSHSNAGEDDPRPSEAAPQPQPYHRSASQGLSSVRIPSTRFPPTTKLWEPRSSSRSASRQRRSASGGAGTPRTWKPPTSVHQEPLGFPSHLITEKLKHQGSFAFVQYHDPLPSGPPPLPTRAVGGSDAPTRPKNGGYSTPNRTTAAAPNGGMSATVAQSPFDR